MLAAILLLCGTQSQAFSEIPEGYTVVPVSSAADVAAYLNTGSHAFTADSSLDLTGWTSTTSSGGSAIFQVEGDMKVTAEDTNRTTFFNGNTTDSALRIENTGMFEMENGYIKAHTVSFSGNGSSSVYIHGSTSTSTGGAITQATTSSNSGSLVVENQASAVFSDNKASNGGVIYRKYGQLTFDNNKLLDFQNNTATSNGGAIYCATSATLEVTNNEVAVFSGVVKDAATWNTKANRTLNVEIDNSGYETIFRNGVQADTVKLSNASTLVAQKENGTARVGVTAHKGAQAQLKAVDVTDTGLALHENNQNGETRGLMENAAVILGDDTAVAAFLTIDEASPVSAAASYAVSNIDFVNTTLTAMAGSGVTLSNVSFDAASAVKGDGSGMHLLAGQANVLTLANNPMEVDTQAVTITYTTTQLDGFTLAGGAGLLLDASALDLPAVAYGEYTMSIVLAGFTATDATPSVTITGQRWDSAGTVDYSWATGNVGLVATFTAMVPEPATSTLSLLALAALAARRRRK